VNDIDPEVLADIQLRNRSQYDRTRTGAPEWTPPKIHSHVPCRNRCGAVTEWTEDAEERFEIFNRILARRNEAQLDRTKIVFCDKCRGDGAKQSSERNRKLVDAVAVAIRGLKDGCDAARELELLAKLDKAGHPDIAGLKQWLGDKAKGKSRVKKGDM
jgi:hypothetical protein